MWVWTALFSFSIIAIAADASTNNPSSDHTPSLTPDGSSRGSRSRNAQAAYEFHEQSQPVFLKHKIVIQWNAITGLQRINKHIDTKLKHDQRKSDSDSKSTTNSNTQQIGIGLHCDNIQLHEQLIIELTTYPELQTLQYNSGTRSWQLLHSKQIRSYYIGLEYTLHDAHHILNSLLHNNTHNNSHSTHNYSVNLNHKRKLQMPNANAVKFSKQLNHSLPVWIWIPLLTHHSRVLFENLLLVGNMSIFLWTLYQLTKYTSGFYFLYRKLLYPLLNLIAGPIIVQIYYVINLLQFNVVSRLLTSVFNLLCYVPVSVCWYSGWCGCG